MGVGTILDSRTAIDVRNALTAHLESIQRIWCSARGDHARSAVQSARVADHDHPRSSRLQRFYHVSVLPSGSFCVSLPSSVLRDLAGIMRWYRVHVHRLSLDVCNDAAGQRRNSRTCSVAGQRADRSSAFDAKRRPVRVHVCLERSRGNAGIDAPSRRIRCRLPRDSSGRFFLAQGELSKNCRLPRVGIVLGFLPGCDTALSVRRTLAALVQRT